MNAPRNNEVDYLLYTDLLQKYSRNIHVFCLRWAKDSTDAGELVHEVHLALWQRIDKCRSKSTEGQRLWLYRVMRSVLVDHWRHTPDVDVMPIDSAMDIAAPEADAAAEIVRELASYLDAADRRLVERLLEGYSRAEIAKELGISPEAIKKRFTRLEQKMRIIKTKIYG